MEIFKLDNDISFLGKALLLDDSLVIGDVHIGFEEALNKEGFLVPRTQFKQIFTETEQLLKKVSVKKIIINGDFKHEFGRISRQEWNDTFKMVELFMKYTNQVILLKGNHDKILGPIAEKYNVEIIDYFFQEGTFVCHGDSIPDETNNDFKNAETVVIGHEHPCVTVRDDHKFEKFKSFLVGTYADKRLIVMPSFNPVEGVDVAKERVLSPFLKKNDSFYDFDVYVTADEIYPFGKLRDFIKKR